MAIILVVDDQANVRYTLGEILSEAGHTIIEADCAKAALARVSDVDLVLTDYAMPDISGLELLDAIRKSHAGMPVVMLTARGSEETAVAALKAGASDYLVKPANVDELCLAVEGVGDGAAPQGQPSASRRPWHDVYRRKQSSQRSTSAH